MSLNDSVLVALVSVCHTIYAENIKYIDFFKYLIFIFRLFPFLYPQSPWQRILQQPDFKTAVPCKTNGADVSNNTVAQMCLHNLSEQIRATGCA